MIIGIIFGLLAIFGIEFSLDVGGVPVNTRDAAPLCVSLIFGSPAGIIGSIERWFFTLWGAGELSRLACSLAIILAGFFGAFLQKYMFDNKKPSWVYGLAAGVVMEVLHMLLVFFITMSDVRHAFVVAQHASNLMIILNGLSVMLAVILVSLAEKEAAARIDKELEFAKAIQHSALPPVFPPYPNRKDFDLYASMNTAKEVGGDFYDFYMLDEERLAFLVADVSGKGIPAAMFMMTAKTQLKSLAETGMNIAEVFTQSNQKLSPSCPATVRAEVADALMTSLTIP